MISIVLFDDAILQFITVCAFKSPERAWNFDLRADAMGEVHSESIGRVAGFGSLLAVHVCGYGRPSSAGKQRLITPVRLFTGVVIIQPFSHVSILRGQPQLFWD